MDMAGGKELSLFSQIEFNFKAPIGFPLSCPTLDLATTWDGGGKDLLIYRPPAQVVSKIHQVGASGTKAPEAVAVTWKPDGIAEPSQLTTYNAHVLGTVANLS